MGNVYKSNPLNLNKAYVEVLTVRWLKK